ncbi:hypothetical protein KM043_008114 [Ampulex compressa]|nr:hypothetical protein KM043_008114 [Ampulex compressa]
MENVYVIKVKTKPALSSLYPSERRYSASTVGGLSFVHFGLGALSLLLGTLALSLQGPILSVACLVPFVTGLLAWRRWYIDRNITIFFYGSLFSLIAAILCFVATAFDIAAASENSSDSLWSLRRILDSSENAFHSGEYPEGPSINKSTFPMDNAFNSSYDHLDILKSTLDTPTMPQSAENISPSSDRALNASSDWQNAEDFGDYGRSEFYEDLNGEASSVYERRTIGSQESLEGSSMKNISDRSLEMIKDKVVSLWHENYQNSSHAKLLLTVNVLVASLLEIFWSALSARIAFRGMMNRLPESDYGNNGTGGGQSDVVASQKRKPPPPRPDILDHDRRLSDSLQNLTTLHNLRNGAPRLPLPESSREFRERVEKFLANQAAHRVVEGSCT